MGRKKAQGAQR